MKTATWTVITLALLGLPASAAAQAATEAPAPPAVAPSPQPSPVPAPPAPVKALASEKDGFGFESADGRYKLRLTGYAQLDGRFYPGDEAGSATDAFVARRVRPILQGTLGDRFEFYLCPDFGGGTAVIQDASMDVRLSSKLRLRAGKFKTPFGLERLGSGAALFFVERALPTNVAPNRDLGAQVLGELAGGVVGYAVAVTNGVGDGGSVDVDTNDGKDVTGRLVLRPFRKSKDHPLRDLTLAFAAGTGNAVGAPSGYRSPGQLTFFSYVPGVAADGRRTRFSPQASLFTGRFGALAEYVQSRQELAAPRVSGEVKAEAWQVAATFVLTGEPASASGVKPKRPYGTDHGWGALELAARANGFSGDEQAFLLGFADRSKSARQATAFAVGLNWHLSRHFKLVADYERTSFEGGARGGDRPAENALFFRTQISY